jgi:hypothetical protein
MSDVPKCTSWRGHRFEGRYSSEPAGEGWPKMNAHGKAAIDGWVRLTTIMTYERDICVRCGATVEKPPPPTNQEHGEG